MRQMIALAADEDHNEGASTNRWMISYADFITLLFVLFLVLYAKTPKLPAAPAPEPAKQAQVAQPTLPTPPVKAAEPAVIELPVKVADARHEPQVQGPAQPQASVQPPAQPPLPPQIQPQLQPRMQPQDQLPVQSRLPAQPQSPAQSQPQAQAQPRAQMPPQTQPPAQAPAQSQPQSRPIAAPPVAAAPDPQQALLEKLNRSLSEFTGAGNIVTVARKDGIVLEISDTALFASGTAQQVPRAQEIIEKLVAAIGNGRNAVIVEGHTDNVPVKNPQFPSNWELSSARAASVARALQERGVDPDRLTASGMAQTKPRSSNQTEQGRRENRRVSLIILNQ